MGNVIRVTLVTSSIMLSILNWWVPGSRSYALYGDLPYLPEIRVVDGKLTKIDGHTPAASPVLEQTRQFLPPDDGGLSAEDGPLPAGGGL